MRVLNPTAKIDRETAYRELKDRLAAIYSGERNGIANAANTASVLFHTLPELNWVGFYFLMGDELVLGPFQGKVACVRIALGRGVCGAAAARRRTVIVPDVHAFPGHIACDSASRSEIVVPLLRDQRVLGVLDLDSPVPARFDAADAAGIEAIAEIFVDSSDLGGIASDH